jgi:hypothetical protein
MKRFVITALLLLSIACAEAQTEKTEMFSVDQTETCSRVAINLATFYSMLIDGAPLEVVRPLFENKKIEGDFTKTTVEELAKISSTGARTELVAGYYQSKCLNTLLDLATPTFSSVRKQLEICASERSASGVMMCATRQTAKAAVSEKHTKL